MIIDNLDNTAEKQFVHMLGIWGSSQKRPGYYATNYFRCHSTGGEKTVEGRWGSLTLPTGIYRVYAWWPAFSNYASNVPYVIKNGEIELATIRVDQQINGGQWNLLGEYMFDAGKQYVYIHNGDTLPSFVIADAVKFDLVEEDLSSVSFMA